MQRVCTFAQACLSLRHSTKYHVLAQMSVWVPFMRTAKALASLHICTGSPEPSIRIVMCVSFISVGNQGDHLIQNANFVYEKPLIQGKIFEISLVIPNGFYSNKMQWRTQIELVRRCMRESWIWYGFWDHSKAVLLMRSYPRIWTKISILSDLLGFKSLPCWQHGLTLYKTQYLSKFLFINAIF